MTAASPAHAITGPIERGPGSFTYRLGLLIVAGTMVLLPVAYIAIGAAAAYGIYFYANHTHAALIDTPPAQTRLIGHPDWRTARRHAPARDDEGVSPRDVV